MKSGFGDLWCLFPLCLNGRLRLLTCVIFALTLDVGAGGWEHSEEAYGLCVCVSERLTGDDLEMLSMSGGWMAAILVIPGIFVWAGGRS